MKYKFYAELLRNKSPFAIAAMIIRLTIKRRYNHIEIVAVPQDPNFPVMYYGAVAPKSRKATREEVRAHYEVIERYELKMKLNYTGEQVIEYLEAQLDVPYAYKQNLFLLPMACWVWLKRQWSQLWVNGVKEMNCTEFSARPIVERFGYVLRTGFDTVEFEDIVIPLKAEQSGVSVGI